MLVGTQVPHTTWPRGQVGGRATTRCGIPGRAPTLPYRLYIAFPRKTLNTRASIHEKFRSRHRRQP